MHEQGAWWLHRFYPIDPAPGTYAISAANLMGGIWNNQTDFAYFRDRQPAAIIGNSIYVYTIEPRGSAVDLSLAGLQLDQIDPAVYRQFNSNDVRSRWFDATSSLIAAPNGSWLAIADDQPLAPELAALLADKQPITRAVTLDDHRPYALYQFDLGQRLSTAAQHSLQTTTVGNLPIKFDNAVELIGYQLNEQDSGLTLVTYWRAGDRAIAPLQMFVHVLGRDGSIVAQQDRLDVPAEGWHAGDVFVQVHHLDRPEQAASVAIGLYQPATGQRLPVVVNAREVDQRLILKTLDDSP
jgi:hypothetical protein